ncbi:hypothetical protein MBUL_02551 [Methylobacterium bullatum]|uniref:Uncharacterized protein n=1 Tax=Methylobacterium bullatum TaxID=570505 RepID=A0A679IZ46_9HYPH|nr:hypothetical protein MBUL_02551 [Methylobacterium bullatum]
MANRLTLNTVAEVSFASAKGFEGALQKPLRYLEPSFEAATRRLRMR